MHKEILYRVKKKNFLPGTFGCLYYEITIKGKYRNISYFSVFLQCSKKLLFTRIKSHYNRMLVKGPYLSCEVKTWVIISYGKLKMQKLKLAMSIVVGEKLNSWQSPNVLRKLHNYSKLIYGHTYKLVLKYFIAQNAYCSRDIYLQ